MSTAVGNSLSDVVTSGEFQRRPSQFRNWIRADGSTEFLPESGRYHLYVSLACPWAHRTLIVRALKGLESHIGVSVVNWRMRERGWTFDPAPGVIPDTINNCATMPDLYKLARPDYEGRFTVPVLWDKKLRTIVNNESSEIIRMLNKEFNHIAGNPELDLYPAELASGIDKWNDLVYNSINNGVYRCGFATTQEAYEKAFDALFAGLQTVEEHLNSHRYLCGSRLTEADIRLFTTLVRFDAVYYGHFKCNLRRLADYPNLSGLMRELYQLPKVAATVNLHHIKHHYYESHPSINPTGIVPKGPLLDFSAPPGRLHLHADPICFAATRNVESP